MAGKKIILKFFTIRKFNNIFAIKLAIGKNFFETIKHDPYVF